MAHFRSAVLYIEDGSTESDEDDLDAPTARATGRRHSDVVLDADQYITKVVGERSSSDIEVSDPDGYQEIAPSTYTSSHKGKRKAGERIQFSDSEEDAYTKFKNRAKVKRKKTVAATAKNKKRVKDAVVGRREAKENGEESRKKHMTYGDESDNEILEDMPEYLKTRRKVFEGNREKLQEAGLRLPPDYKEVEFSDDDLEHLEERPSFPTSVEESRPYKDIDLPYSGGTIPGAIARYLRDYQIDGVAFLHKLFVYQKGGILGDDMGLGKTVQVAAFLTAAFGKTGDERDGKRMRKMRRANGQPWYPRALVICPGSLIENWKQELNRWGWWHVDAFHGTEKESVLASITAGRLEVVITTYQTYKMQKDNLNLIEWDCVIADECHIMKEKTSETTKSMNEINALCRIGLTGTAIQNKYEELWTLLNWTSPGRLGPISQWKDTISEPLRMGQSHNATLYQLKRARETATKLVENLLPEFFLRRMKSLIAHQLPKKSDKVVFCPLSDIQRDAYERFLHSPLAEIVKNSSEYCECKSGKKRGWCCHTLLPNGDKWQVVVFPVIGVLQKLSNHLALLIPSSTDPHDKQDRDLTFMQLMLPGKWKELYNNRDSLVNLSNPEYCGKWKILKKLLKYWHGNGDKVLVFSHSVRLLKMLRHLFQNTAYNVSYLDGSLAYEDRQKEVDEFNSDPGQFVFLISTKAGGVGLNITSANKVVIMDPNWNPSYDLQAQDRAYRIGQVRDVEVFRLVSSGTVEEIVYARQIYKQQQANIGYNASTERRYFKGVQNAPGAQGEIFGLRNLLTFNPDDVFLRDIVNKTNVAEAKAGVNMIGVDLDTVDDEDDPLRLDGGERNDEDAAMSQLAQLLIAGDEGKVPKKAKPQAKTDAIMAILASAGVSYTHENSEVVGPSKVEAHLSRRAEETGNDISVMEEILFASSPPRGVEEDPDLSFDADGFGLRSDGTKIKYIYHPPEDVMLRQFCTMAKEYGFESATAFALVVEGWTTQERRACLEKFYRQRKERLGLEASGENEREASDDEGGVYPRTAPHGDAELVEAAMGGVAETTAPDGEADGDNDDLDNYEL